MVPLVPTGKLHMETRAHYILVGLFTLVAGASALLFALWLTNAGIDREVNYYDVLFSRTSVRSLCRKRGAI